MSENWKIGHKYVLRDSTVVICVSDLRIFGLESPKPIILACEGLTMYRRVNGRVCESVESPEDVVREWQPLVPYNKETASELAWDSIYNARTFSAYVILSCEDKYVKAREVGGSGYLCIEYENLAKNWLFSKTDQPVAIGPRIYEYSS